MVRIATRTASKGNGMVGDYDRLRRRGHIISLSHKAVPLYSELPRKAHSRKLAVASPATNIPFYSAQSSVAPVSCSLLPGYSHTCCEDLLRGATGCCSRVAGDFRHPYPSYYVFERRWWLWRQVLVYEFLPLNAVVHGQGGFENAAVLLYAEGALRRCARLR